MDNYLIQKLSISLAVVLFATVLGHILKYFARRAQQKFDMRKSRYFTIRRLITFATACISIALLLFVWNVNAQNAWGFITSILAVIAIAFFAIWSLVGNMLAGVIIYFTSPFKIDDYIEVSPDEIRGQVMAINTFYTVLQDEDRNYINIPNTLLFQKYIRVKSRHSKAWGEPRPSDTQK